MTIIQLEAILIKKGYERLIGVKPEEIKVFYQELNDRVIVLLMLELKENMNFMSEDFLNLQNKVKNLFSQASNIQLFSVVFAEDIEKASSFSKDNQECWIYDTINKRTIIYENQSPNFYGLYEILESNIEYEEKDIDVKPEIKLNTQKIPVITIGLIIINLFVFVWLEILGSTENAEFMAEHGALYAPYIQDGNQYFRFLTSMFMHFGINHILNNIIMLFCIGEMLEKQIGKVSYLTIYLVSGIGANLISYWYYLNTDIEVVSAGASGAIFGIVGALLVVVIFNKGRLESVTTPRLLFMIGLSLYLGFTEVTTNNAAHIGGLIFGVMTSILTSLITILKRKKN